jgi:hypothetical protein
MRFLRRSQGRKHRPGRPRAVPRGLESRRGGWSSCLPFPSASAGIANSKRAVMRPPVHLESFEECRPLRTFSKLRRATPRCLTRPTTARRCNARHDECTWPHPSLHRSHGRKHRPGRPRADQSGRGCPRSDIFSSSPPCLAKHRVRPSASEGIAASKRPVVAVCVCGLQRAHPFAYALRRTSAIAVNMSAHTRASRAVEAP